MRKIQLLFLLPLFLLAGCSGGNGPEGVAEDFTKALYTADFEGAKSMCTEDTKQAVDFVAAFVSNSVDKMKDTNIKFSVANVDMAEDGNSAVVEGYVNGAYDLNEDAVKDSVKTKVHLIKSGDKWLVEYKVK